MRSSYLFFNEATLNDALFAINSFVATPLVNAFLI
jgi:hypothetical protein